MSTHILLNPGPVSLSNKVREALLNPDMCHRENNFSEMAIRIQSKLENVYREMESKYKAVLLTGSGTSAVEAMLSTFVPKSNSSSLILANGVYGERMANMLERQGKKTHLLSSEWCDEIQFKEAEKLLSSENDILYVITVHNETTTGRLNDIKRLTGLCKKYNKFLLVDAVSSFGGELFDFIDEFGTVKAIAATANKCLHSTPGVSFVLAQKELLESGKSNSLSLYLDLIPYYEAQKKGFSPFTQAVHNYFALEAALDEFEEKGGIKNRHARYLELSRRIQDTLNKLGFTTFLQIDYYSSMISSFNVPDHLTYDEIHGACYDAGFIIYAGQGGFAGSMFRIANMGNIQNSDVDRLISVFQKLSQN